MPKLLVDFTGMFTSKLEIVEVKNLETKRIPLDSYGRFRMRSSCRVFDYSKLPEEKFEALAIMAEDYNKKAREIQSLSHQRASILRGMDEFIKSNT